MQFLEISWDFGILGFSKILGFFQRFFGIFDEVYEDFQSNLPLACRWTRVVTFQSFGGFSFTFLYYKRFFRVRIPSGWFWLSLNEFLSLCNGKIGI